MNNAIQSITPFLWFESNAEEAAESYVSVFPRSRITGISRYSEEMAQASGRIAESVMAIDFVLDGIAFTAFNGGPQLRMNGAISLVINCQSQDEVDRYWMELSKGGDPAFQQCGWLLDRFGMSWQVVPTRLTELLKSRIPGVAGRVGAAMLTMKKLDIAKLEDAASA